MKPSALAPIGLLTSLVQRSVRQLVAAQVEPLGLSIQEFWTLVAIAEHAASSQAEVAARQHVDEATTCRVVKALGDAGLLAAVRDPDDRRRVRLELTSAGGALARRVLPVAREIRLAIEDALRPEEREATRAALGKVLARLEGLIAASAATPGPRSRPPARRAPPSLSPARQRAAGRSRSSVPPRGSP